MKRSAFAAPIFSFVLIISPLRAQNTSSVPAPSSPASAPRIVTLNFNAAVLGTAEAQKSLGALEKKYAPREQQLQKLNDAVEALKKNLDANGSTLTEAQKNQRLQELAAREKQLQREAEDFKNDSQAESQQLFQQIAQKVFAFLQQFSQQHGYDAVLERGTETAPVVWYAAKDVDITEQVIRGYDAKSASAAQGLPNAPATTSHPSATAPKQP
jgi:outer membrane protein